MTLSKSTKQKLGIALTSEVISCILMDDRWMEFTVEIIPEVITEKMGGIDHDLLYDLSQIVLENIRITAYDN